MTAEKDMRKLMDKILSGSLRGLALSAFALAVPAVSHAQFYTVIDLGVLSAGATSGTNSVAYAINNNGFITGSGSNNGIQNTRALLADGNLASPVFSDMGTAGTGISANGFAINSSKVVAGSANITNPGSVRPAYFDGSGAHDAGIISPAVSGSLRGINDGGLAVGSLAPTSTSLVTAVTYQTGGGGTLTSLAPKLNNAAASNALAINNSGQIAGAYGPTQATAQLFRYNNNTGVLESLGTLPGGTSVGTSDGASGGFGINASGKIAGFGRFNSTVNHAFLYDNTGIRDLGTLNTVVGANSGAYGINTAGDVVGASQIAGGVAGIGTYRAFIYKNGTAFGQGDLLDLNTVTTNLTAAGFASLNAAYGINDNGWIVGVGTTTLKNAPTHAFLLKPTVPGVPEPSSVLALGMGILGAGAMVRRRRK